MTIGSSFIEINPLLNSDGSIRMNKKLNKKDNYKSSCLNFLNLYL